MIIEVSSKNEEETKVAQPNLGIGVILVDLMAWIYILKAHSDAAEKECLASPEIVRYKFKFVKYEINANDEIETDKGNQLGVLIEANSGTENEPTSQLSSILPNSVSQLCLCNIRYKNSPWYFTYYVDICAKQPCIVADPGLAQYLIGVQLFQDHDRKEDNNFYIPEDTQWLPSDAIKNVKLTPQETDMYSKLETYRDSQKSRFEEKENYLLPDVLILKHFKCVTKSRVAALLVLFFYFMKNCFLLVSTWL